MNAIAASRPIASQLVAIEDSMMSEASWKVRAATSQREKLSQTARRSCPFALEIMSRTAAMKATTVAAIVINNAIASMSTIAVSVAEMSHCLTSARL